MGDRDSLAASYNPRRAGGRDPGAVRDLLLASIPKLRAFAISLCRNSDRADDLVQDALLRAYANIASFQPGSNMFAWLCTILRNHFYTQCRRGRRRLESLDSLPDGKCVKPEQTACMEYRDLCAALAQLPPKHRQALLMVSVSGLAYDEAAKICRCPTGTIKSRVNRARSELARMLSIDGTDTFEEDPLFSAVIATGDHFTAGV